MFKLQYIDYISKINKHGNKGKLSDKSQKSYLTALNTLSKYFKANGYSDKDIFEIGDLTMLYFLDKVFINDRKLRDFNEKGKRNYSAAFHHYIRMIESSGDIYSHIDPLDIINENELYEGVKTTVLVNKYERNIIARKKCLDFHGFKCKICAFDFEDVYGELGHEFIHVHHIIPLNEISVKYIVDPVNDLIPVCPNCHAMLHKKLNGKTITVTDLKHIISKDYVDNILF